MKRMDQHKGSRTRSELPLNKASHLDPVFGQRPTFGRKGKRVNETLKGQALLPTSPRPLDLSLNDRLQTATHQMNPLRTLRRRLGKEK